MQMVCFLLLHPNYKEDYAKCIPTPPNASQWAKLLGMQEVVCIPSTNPYLGKGVKGREEVKRREKAGLTSS